MAKSKLVDPFMVSERRYDEECGPVETVPLVEWCSKGTSRLASCCEPVVKISRNVIYFNSAACDVLGDPEYVKVGWSRLGELCFKPVSASERDVESFKLTPVSGTARGKSKYVKSGRLIKWLAGKGAREGVYTLEYDKAGHWVGRGVK